jgi:hypothetical protein
MICCVLQKWAGLSFLQQFSQQADAVNVGSASQSLGPWPSCLLTPVGDGTYENTALSTHTQMVRTTCTNGCIGETALKYSEYWSD